MKRHLLFSIALLLLAAAWSTACGRGSTSIPYDEPITAQAQSDESSVTQEEDAGTEVSMPESPIEQATMTPAPGDEESGETEVTREETMSGEPTISSPQDPFWDRMVTQAKEDLASRLSIEVDQINLLEVREVTWPDYSLGCPQPGVAYEQVPQDGLLIRLGVGRRMYFYHSGGTRDPFLCEQTSQVLPKVTPKYDEFVPPPDSEID